MKYETVNYSESVESFSEIGLKRWRKFEVSASIETGENPDIVKDEIVQRVNSWHGTQSPFVQEQPPKPVPEDLRIAELVKDIESQTELTKINGLGVETGLLGYEKMVAGNETLQSAYDERFKELSK